MITFEHVTFGYNHRRKVFSDLTLSFAEGRIHGLLGCNGFGKTTLLQLACGLLTPDTGCITIDGRSPQHRDAPLFAELILVPEELNLPDISFRRFAALTGAFYPAYSAEAFESNCVALKIDPASNPHKMSMGQRKKGYIAFALACNTRILLMDEPTNGLDIPSKAALRSLLAAYADESRTVIISTHQVREVENLIDNVVILDAEGLALNATTKELADHLIFGALPAGAQAVYSTASLAGEIGIAANKTGAESRPDLELLFTAIACNRTIIPSILHSNSDRHE